LIRCLRRFFEFMVTNIEIRECISLEELSACVDLQREVFGLPEIEISPVRHFIVTKNAGGFTLGAFSDDDLVGFVLSVPAFLRGEKAFYSHMTAVKQTFQSHGIGAKLKWAQRDKSLAVGVNFVKWTFQPIQARNAHFNLNRLGATIEQYSPNFYGTDYSTAHEPDGNLGLDSDRLFAGWNLESEKVIALSKNETFVEVKSVHKKIEIPREWNLLVKTDLRKAIDEQNRVKGEFQEAFKNGLVCRSFDRETSSYLLY
jgi:predicted GNAT superfamily acetyltransferase